MGIDRTIRCGNEDGRMAGMVDGDIRFKAGTAASLFYDVRGVVGWEEMNPAQTDAGGLARVVEALFTNEFGRQDIHSLRGWVLNGDCRSAGSDQVLEPDCHVSGGGIEARASGGVLSGSAGSFVPIADKQTRALCSIGKERCLAHMERIEGALG